MLKDLDSIVATLGIVVATASIVIALSAALRSRGNAASASLVVDKTEVHDYRLKNVPTACRIGFITGDIMKVTTVDVWVNAENTDMEMARINENSISSLIRYFGAERDQAGQVTDDVIANQLAATVGSERPVAPGAAFVTGSGSLAERNNVKHLIHVAAVQGEPGAGFRQVLNVGLGVSNALAAAESLESARTILFPLLGTGTGHGDVASTVGTLINAAVSYLEANPSTQLRGVYFLGYNNREARLLEQAMVNAAFLPADQEPPPPPAQ